jgi:hypothetical protein
MVEEFFDLLLTILCYAGDNYFTAIPRDFEKSAGTICLALPHGRDE